MQHYWPLIWMAIGLGSAHAADGVAEGTIRMAATMNTMASACAHMPSQELTQAKSAQKTAAVRDLGVSAAQFDKLYDQYAQSFQTRWDAMAPAEQQRACAQMPKATP